MLTRCTILVVLIQAAGLSGWCSPAARASSRDHGLYFPPAGQKMENQARRTAEQVGLAPGVAPKIEAYIQEHPYTARKVTSRWALWRHGYLVQVQGDFHQTVDVASLRKTWHAMIVGAAIQQGRIPSHRQKLSTWVPELKGRDAETTWWHVMTQSAGFDYPYGNHPDYPPGQMWTYSDLNLIHLCHGLARVYGKKDYRDRYAEVAKAAYFDAIGLEGWSTRIVTDSSSGMQDGVRFVLSLEHMGRLGLLALAGGTWNGVELVPQWFVEELESKQTRGMKANYNGPNDGKIDLSPQEFPESPYGFLTWVNTDRDLFPGADAAWACGRGAGGSVVLWNRNNGIVFAGVGIRVGAGQESIPRVIESAITGPNPVSSWRGRPALASRGHPGLAFRDAGVPPSKRGQDARDTQGQDALATAGGSFQKVGRWGLFETEVRNEKSYTNPYQDVTLGVFYTKPDGGTVRFWGFYDGADGWRVRFMPDQVGTWRYEAAFSDGSPGAAGTFECVPSDLPGMLSVHEENPIWLGFKGGAAPVIRSLHVGDRFFADGPNTMTGEVWSEQQRTAFLDWAQGQGYNMLSIASHYLNRDTKGRGRGWNTPDLWDAREQRPNPREYQRMERILNDLAARRIMVYPFAGFFGRDSDFPRDEKKQELYLRYTLARLGAYWNVLLLVSGPEPLLNKAKPVLAEDQIHRLGRRIQELDVFGHLLSVHNPTGDDHFRDADWTTHGVLQGPKTLDRKRLSAGLLKNHHAAKPLYAQETLWPGNQYHPKYSPDDIRKNAYVMILSGSTINFADMDGDSSSGFSGTMDLGRKVQERHDIIKAVWDFFKTVPFARMKPRPDLVDNGYCLAEPGRQYLVYLESPGAVTVRVPRGNYDAKWINARNTKDVRDGGLVKTAGPLTTPQDGDDWLLWVIGRGDATEVAVSPGTAEGVFPDLQVDRRGDLHLVYGRQDRVYYRKYSVAKKQWSPEQFTGIADVAWLARSEPDIVIDSRGRPHVFAGSEYARLEGREWVRMRIANTLRDTELAVGPDDTLYLVHRGGNSGGYLGLRKLEAGAWVPLTDPDKPLLGQNDHVYPDLAVSPVDGSLHIAYRHGNPKKTAYRQSTDGGRTWPVQEGITDAEPEAAHIVVDHAGHVYVTNGGGQFFRRTPDGWVPEGRVVESPARGQPELAVDRPGNVYCACWGGRYNIRRDGRWLGPRQLTSATGRPIIGFVEPAGAEGFAYLAWEEGTQGDPDKGMEEGAVIVVRRLSPDGTVADL